MVGESQCRVADLWSSVVEQYMMTNKGLNTDFVWCHLYYESDAH